MSVSIHMNGRPRSQMKGGLLAHQIRKDEEDGIEVAKHTESHINPKLSHLNEVLFNDEGRFEKIREKADNISQQRVSNGQKKMYKNTGIFMVGTLQISDSSLEKLGWQFEDDGVTKKSAGEQSEQTIENVRRVYKAMIKSVREQPEMYGEVFSATIHFDEKSPHVDFLSDPLDVTKPNQTAKDFINGPKGYRRGQRTSEMQDKLMDKCTFPKDVIERYDLKRGTPKKEKVDLAIETRKATKLIDKREKEVKALETQNNARREALDERENEIRQSFVKLNEGFKIVQEGQQRVSEYNERLKAKKSGLDEKEKNIDDKISKFEKMKISFLELSTTTFDRLNTLMEQARDGIIDMMKLKEVIEDHTPVKTEAELLSLSEALDQLADSDSTLSNDDLMLSDDDLKFAEEMML